MKKTLGGDRLSSGKRMQVNLKSYERSSHNKGYIWRNTQSPGTIVPFFVEIGTPGSTMDIDLDMDIMTHPTIGPLFGSFKIDAHIFQCPIRLYHAWLHNNKLKIGMNMASVLLPELQLTAQPSEAPGTNSQINPSCLLAYLGIRGIGATTVEQPRSFNGVPLLAYWDIYKNYYSNKQEEVGAYIKSFNVTQNETVDTLEIGGTAIPEGTNSPTPPTVVQGAAIEVTYTGAAPNPADILITFVTQQGLRTQQLNVVSNDLTDDTAGTITGTWTFATPFATIMQWNYQNQENIPLQPPQVANFDLINVDTMRENLLAHNGTTPFNINSQVLEPYNSLLTVEDNGRNPRLNTQEGLGIKTYQSDLFNNWLNTEWIDGAGGITERSRVSTAGDFFTLDDLLMGRKMYDLLNRIGVSGGTYKDWIEAAYTEIDWNKVESPVYWGGLIKELVFQEVVSNSAGTDNGTPQPLGTLAGKGVLAKKHKGGKIVVKCEEHSVVMGLVTITPRIDYSQGNEWHTHLRTMDDFHKPAFDEIGFQELITEQMDWRDTTWNVGADEWETRSAGKQPAWLNYMTAVNKTYGNFAIGNDESEVGEMFMTLNRRYEMQEGEIKDLTTYIDPAKYNFIFADTSIDAMNFWVQIAIDYTYRAKMSGKLMPNL